MGSGEMSVNLPDQSASLPFQDLAGQTVDIDKRETVKQDLSNYQSTFPYQTSPCRLAIQFVFLPNLGPVSAASRGPEFASSAFPSRLEPVLPVFKTQAMGKISVNQTRGHRCYKWLCG